MAEYINRQDLDFLNDFRIDSGKYVGLRLDDVFDELATADVVERSKINKAIEELCELVENRGFLSCESSYIQSEIKKIFKRNIGE